MTYDTRSAKQAETSQQESLRMMQQDLHGFMEGSDKKFGKLQEWKIAGANWQVLSGMNVLVKSQDN